jgi:LPXTG-site transpeptidase (sortase) family protein
MNNFLPENDEKLFILQTAGIFLIAFVVLFSVATLFGLIPEELSSTNKNNPTTTPRQAVVNSINPSTGEVQYEYKPISYNQQNGASATSVQTDSAPTQQQTEEFVVGTSPDSISIPEIDLQWNIEKPSSPHIDVLNDALDAGPVYYPGSGFVESGNVFLFGHSSYLPIVNNKAYKAFNDIQKLSIGDEIFLQAKGKTYVYSVTKVTLKDADDAEIKLNQTGRYLTLSTCNVFGQKSDRWVVDAVFKEVR